MDIKKIKQEKISETCNCIICDYDFKKNDSNLKIFEISLLAYNTFICEKCVCGISNYFETVENNEIIGKLKDDNEKLKKDIEQKEIQAAENLEHISKLAKRIEYFSKKIELIKYVAYGSIDDLK